MHCKTQCVDVMHDLCGVDMREHNLYGDIFVFMNIMLLICGLIQKWINWEFFVQYALILIFLHSVRGMMAFVTTCKANCNVKQSPWSSRSENEVWFMISGHTLNTLIITGLILNSNFPVFIKYLSVSISVMVCFFQTATREHYTSDIFITACLVFLSTRTFIR